jgi:GDP-D-mannose dehydratase
LGNPYKAAQKLGWVASKKFRDIIKELILAEKMSDRWLLRHSV